MPKVHTGLSCGCERQSDCGDNGRFRVVICTKLEIWLPELRSSGRHVGQLQLLQTTTTLQTLFLLHSFVRRPPNASASFTLNSQHSYSALQWPQKLPLRPRWYVHLATLSTPKRANSTDCTTLTRRTSPAYTHHSVSEGVRPSFSTTSINADLGWVSQRQSQRCRHSASATQRPSASQVNSMPNRRPST